MDTLRTEKAFSTLALLLVFLFTHQVAIGQTDDGMYPGTSYTYDQAGNLLTKTDANNHTTTWTYDFFGRVLSRTLPDNQQETFVYSTAPCTAGRPATTPPGEPDPVCELITHTDFNGDTITTLKDVMQRVEQISYSKDGRVDSFTYWPGSRLKTATTPEGTTEYFYDNRHRQLISYEIRPNDVRLDYEYDNVRNRELVKVTRGGVVTKQHRFTYDGLNRLKTVVDELNPTNTTSYTYDRAGNLDTVTYSNGRVLDYDYNSVNQITDVYTKDLSGNVLLHLNYKLSPSGRREVVTESTGRTTAYCYDALYRLRAETVFEDTQDISNGCLSDADRATASYKADYRYDFAGNRRLVIINDDPTEYTYDANDRLLTDTKGTVYDHDDNGNLISKTGDDGVTTYGYDGRNRLTSVDSNDDQITYTYNHNGIRTSKTVNGVTTEYIIDENREYAQVLEEIVGGELETGYVYGLDLISQTRGDEEYFYHMDALGSTRALSDSTGDFVNLYTYNAYGDLNNNSELIQNDYLFAGENYDRDQGQYYLRDRWYNQGSGRFNQQDRYPGQLFDPMSQHKYQYAHADPVNNTDPSGLFTLSGVMSAINIRATLGTLSTNSARSALSRFLVGGTAGTTAAGTTSAGSGSLGLIGNLVVREMREAVIDMLLDYAVSGIDPFDNKSTFGTKAHTRLEERIKALNKDLNKRHKIFKRWGIDVQAEAFFDKGTGNPAGRREKGSFGLDVTIFQHGKVLKSFDLKTGRGWSKKEAGKRASKLGANLFQIFVVPKK